MIQDKNCRNLYFGLTIESGKPISTEIESGKEENQKCFVKEN